MSTTSLKPSPQTNNNTRHRSLSNVAERGCDWAGRWIVLLSCKSINLSRYRFEVYWFTDLGWVGYILELKTDAINLAGGILMYQGLQP